MPGMRAQIHTQESATRRRRAGRRICRARQSGRPSGGDFGRNIAGRQFAFMRDIILRAFALAQAVETFVGHAREFYYEVMLSNATCPRCEGDLRMLRESHCRCVSCGSTFDPTVAFQRCPDCDGRVRLRIFRYRCVHCGADVRSRFVFDARVYDAEYFRERMAQSRQRKLERCVQAREAFIDTRSAVIPPVSAGLEDVPGLIEALNGLVTDPMLTALIPLAAKGLDLKRYETHVQACLCGAETAFDDIPPLENNRRLDRIWRFITIIFMAHAGAVGLRQDGSDITVIRCGTDRKRPNVFNELEVPDGIA